MPLPPDAYSAMAGMRLVEPCHRSELGQHGPDDFDTLHEHIVHVLARQQTDEFLRDAFG